MVDLLEHFLHLALLLEFLHFLLLKGLNNLALLVYQVFHLVVELTLREYSLVPPVDLFDDVRNECRGLRAQGRQ